MKKIWYYAKLFWYGLFHGLKSVDENMLSQYGASSDNEGASINKQQESNRISQAMLRGELTQEVQELRYRTYKVDREAKQYEYYSPTLVMKRDEKLDTKFVSYENSDNLEIVTIQPNHAWTEGVLDGIQEFEGHRKLTDYVIKVKRDIVARYRLEAFTKRLVVRKRDDNRYVLDFYVSKYPDDKDFTTAGFLSELKRIRDNEIKPFIFDMEEVSFLSSHAYRVHDMVMFVFRNVYYKEITEFDGHYIVRFNASLKTNYDTMDSYYCKEMDDKYKNKVKKEVVLDIFGGGTKETYVCERCGKVIEWDTSEIDDMDVTKPREIDEEIDETTPSNLEYRDIQMAEMTFGKRLCKDCLEEYLKEHNLI